MWSDPCANKNFKQISISHSGDRLYKHGDTVHHKQKHMASRHIHMQTKVSNKSVYRTVKTDRSPRACWPYSRVGCAPTLHKSRWERNLVLFFITNQSIVWGRTVLAMCPMIVTRFCLGQVARWLELVIIREHTQDRIS